MKKLTMEIPAHADAGKIALSEGLLSLSENIRKLGRMDHGDAFSDTAILEQIIIPARFLTSYFPAAVL